MLTEDMPAGKPVQLAAASSEAWPLTQAQMVVVAEGPALRAG
ncbi:predicted protein [Sclerotinia sclerotiorum 1980 UF-70]|uniref:Uncharacterized protein n=1 Tax=Sclerotinia sclerotiorum (strain ATCC 18683 / 1980 / Ss-1) TaxID=665079 RepID=A7ELM4_SCLS1|nr:predicted protein [Sclerotinia sclerotiorum 1980 UF-70]EDO03740.1 predicted protein [Sclerotinia sclerotiorum 1980 UF-70]